MVLQPLEFTEGLTDSPYFRETLQAHERELDHTNTAIKHLIKDIQALIVAARNLSRAQRTLSETLNNFNFECIGSSQTEDELVIANSFKDFARLLSTIEDERDRLLEKADEAFLEPIERFRREQIGNAKEAKKKFDKETGKYCQSLERYLNLSAKKSENQLLEADANHSMEQTHFFKAMSDYVLKLQEVNERKKFEFVETILSFMLGWLTFYHQGHEIATDFYSVKMELQMRLQRTRHNFHTTQEEAKILRKKMIANQEKFKQTFSDSSAANKNYSRQGYLFLMEKKAFTTSWTKHFCKYEKDQHRMTVVAYTQTVGKITSTEEIIVKECIKRNNETSERRFCFDIVTYPDEKGSSASTQSGHGQGQSNGGSISGSSHQSSSATPPGDNVGCPVYTFQALSEEDYKIWLQILEARDPYPPINAHNTNGGSGKHSLKKGDYPKTGPGVRQNPSEMYELDDEGYCFVRKCIQYVNANGMELRGIYRMVGVTSKVNQLMETFMEHRQKSHHNKAKDPNCASGDDVDLLPNLNLQTEEFEIKTITSALKNYLRHLSEPIMTFQLHHLFIAAAKLDNRFQRLQRVHQLVHRLPELNFKVLKVLIEHLQKVSKEHEKNLMTPSNLGVCFGPTLLRTAEETVAAILDIKFVNVIAEMMIEHYDVIFLTKPTVCADEAIHSNYITKEGEGGLAEMTQSSYVTLQKRPLPNVPNSGIYGTTGHHHPSAENKNILLPYESYASRQSMVPSNAAQVRRSSSQDQLYGVTGGTMYARNRVQYGVPSNSSSGQLIHPQHLTYSNYSMGQHQIGRQPTPGSPRNRNRLQSGTSGNMQPIYQSPMTFKTGAPASPNTIYGHIRSPNQMIQPSVSYQNLHYKMDDMNLTSRDYKGSMKQPPPAYNRPMTSIGIISTYGSTVTTDLSPQGEPIKPGFGTVSSQAQASLNYRPPSNPTLQVRNLNYSAPMSASLPSTPEHSQQQFPYKLPGGQGNPLKPSMTPSPPNQALSSPNVIDGVVGEPASSEIYSRLSSSNANMYPYYIDMASTSQAANQQSIYDTLGAQVVSPRAPVVAVQQMPLPSTKVRTRYVCIGGTDTELSFQPNMIITNVRHSREPGWIEGTLNGKTGLIPLNYVEFLD